MGEKFMPEIMGDLRSFMLTVPKAIYKCSGISIFGRRIKSVLFSTDVSIIRNSNADAIIAVYPFTPQPIITQSVMMAADVPVFCGVGGGRTGGTRSLTLAIDAEQQGAMGVVLNAPTINDTIKSIYAHIDIPIVVTIANRNYNIDERLEAGVSIFNVSAAKDTANVVREIRAKYKELPIIATGGPSDETILETIEAGANAITWTPPSSGEIFAGVMNKYRDGNKK